ncbi:L,D-transpeptidase [Aquabacter sp. CN5-332]|uniref:L,D-transpeptidase family protein n=1 Tax=Aquabacter sp. CN5-332 TaxID=3156608 RepID=UPI0032B57621
MKISRLSACSLAIFFALGGPVLALTANDINQATFSGDTRKDAKKDAKKDARKPDALIVKVQVLLSRRSISPGEIDGTDGENYRKAVAQFRRQNNLGEGDTVDEQTWIALGGPSAGEIMTEYTLSKKDASAHLPRRIPHDYAKQARMKRLDYTSTQEMLAERFHMSKTLLVALNPQAKFRRTGERIVVASVDRRVPKAQVDRIEAVKNTGMVVVYGAGDMILASYPATIGSGDTPSPEGEYTVKRIAHNPPYEYDPEKNFQQGRNKKKLVLAPGPNNPVGTVWIALSKPTFGIHGTPEPSQVSKTSSHGCVRLTNWDAEALADMVKPGVRMRFVN